MKKGFIPFFSHFIMAFLVKENKNFDPEKAELENIRKALGSRFSISKIDTYFSYVHRIYNSLFFIDEGGVRKSAKEVGLSMEAFFYASLAFENCKGKQVKFPTKTADEQTAQDIRRREGIGFQEKFLQCMTWTSTETTTLFFL